MLIASRTHTAGDSRRWIIDYSRWLDNTATIVTVDISSSSATCTANSGEVKGKEVIFHLTGGTVGETCTVTLTMTDSFANIKKDTIKFTVVAP
jgi:hypothetical protein